MIWSKHQPRDQHQSRDPHQKRDWHQPRGQSNLGARSFGEWWRIGQNRGKTELSFHSNFLNWDDLIGSRPNIFNSELSNPITNLPESRFGSFLWSSIIQKSIKILIGRIQRTNQRPDLRLRKRWNGIYLENDPNPIC